MSKTKKFVSVFLAVVMLLSLMSAFSFGTVAAENTDKFIYSPFSVIPKNPGYGSVAPSSLVFVSSLWDEAKNGDSVFMKYDNSVYKATMGINAFKKIGDALDAVGAENLKIKVGPGNYEESFSLEFSGMKFYGNYAGLCPNVPSEEIYRMDLNAERDPELESTIIGGTWTWTVRSYNTTVDGFKVSGVSGIPFDIAVSGQHSEYCYFYNNIFENLGTYAFNANKGYSTGTYIKYNRIVNCASHLILAGGSMCDTVIDNNYFEGQKNWAVRFTSVGGNGTETLLSFSDNVCYGCSSGCLLIGSNANFGANLAYYRVTGNVFNKCGGSTVIQISYPLEDKQDAGSAVRVCTDPATKTYISGNTFYDVPTSTIPVKLLDTDGTQYINGDLTGTRNANFIIAVSRNKIIFNTATGTFLQCSAQGIADASYNFYGELDNSGNITPKKALPKELFNIGEASKLVSMPFYVDEEMTELSGGVSLKKNGRAITNAKGFDRDSFKVDNENFKISADALNGFETVDFTDVITPNNYKLYKDFLLEQEVLENKLDLIGDVTRAYLIYTDEMTGAAIRYDVIVNADPDKTKCELREVVDDSTKYAYTDYTVTGDNVQINLPSKLLHFKFSLSVSPSAAYKIYTDEACTKEYVNPTGYIDPDKTLKLYAKITSGDGSQSKIYNFSIDRPGSNDYDARIISVISPEQDVLLFNNQRKTVTYRPFAMIDTATFDFEMAENTTYTIYAKYDASTGKLSDKVSAMGDVKELPVGDAITYFYAEVRNTKYDYSQIYTIIVYNDVKSDDNVITGITGISDLSISDDNLITLDVSSTLSAVNAHFETNAFADVVVYADKDKTYKLTPAITMDVINNREVEVRTFRLGVTSQISYFYIDVTSETGRTNSYSMIASKGKTSIKFADMEGHWADEYVKTAASIGIINGYTDAETEITTFRPDKFASRQEVAAILCRMMGIEPLSFKDEGLSTVFYDAESIAEWSYNYVKAVYKLGVMTGSKDEKGNVKFFPANKITRQEFFVAVSNLLKLDTAAAANYDLSKFKDADKISNWALPATKAIIKAGIVAGDNNGFINPKSNIRRGEIAKIAALINVISKDF